MRSGLQAIVVGAGGHAKVVISTLRAMGWGIQFVYDDDTAKWGQTILGIKVTGPIALLDEKDRLPAVIAVGDPLFRKRLAERYDRDWITVIHPHAQVDDSAIIGPGTVIFAGTVVQPGVNIGLHAIINTSASIDHDCQVGDYAHVAPGTHLAGAVTVGEGAFLGTGASVIPGVTIGPYSIVGAGAVVIRDLPAYSTAVGCPATVIRTRAPEGDL
jgi:sugar O-acyltransferase (sialic acid O-acetyltransferase NeuD family)